ncbi:chromosome partitioning protein [Dietzia alimentaria]|uniref:ParA family protein n=1 Tax=Dietzia TaxID=37914 RepID=UPI000805CE30|nr:ParA family protein [Dietzia sp. 111N12-1]OAV76426.1 chromosome partitioning protein [Dietzia sp. 111N12-1]ODQ86663.1 chromosome partitioning protein [Dietzia alimentaria]
MSYDETPIFAAARQANEVLHGDAPALPRPESPRIVTIANQKGGVGKTTSTVNLAAALALGGLGVLVIDMDPQGNASTALGVDHREGTPSSYDLLMWEASVDELMQKSPHAERLFCVPATIDLAGSEIELVGLPQRERRLAEVLLPEDLQSLGIDYVFLDCPPSLGLLTVNAMVAAREVLIPIQCEYYALEGVGQLLRNVELIQQHLNTDLEISTIMLTMYDGRTKLAEQVAGEVRKHFGDTVLRTVIPRSVKVSEAPGYGMTILQYDAGSRGALAYLDAAREINARGGPAGPGELVSTPTAGEAEGFDRPEEN